MFVHSFRVLLGLSLAVSGGVSAQDYPTRNIVLVVPFTAGGPTDTLGRNLAQQMTNSHLCGLLFLSAIATDVQTVSYKGTAPAMTDLMGGHIDFMCDQTTNTTGQIKAGAVKVYGVTSRTRVPTLKDVPTLHEVGLKGFEVVVWHGLYAPKGTPKAVVDKLNAALQAAVKDPSFRSRLADLGAVPVPVEKATPAALQSQLKADIEKWGPIIKKAAAYAD